MGAMGIGEADILDQGDLFKDIRIKIAFVRASVNDADRYRIAMFENDKHRHQQWFVDGADQSCQHAPRIMPRRQLGGKEEVGLNFGGLNGVRGIEKFTLNNEFGIG